MLGQGKQDNESAVEQAKDEQISGTSTSQTNLSYLPTYVYACIFANC